MSKAIREATWLVLVLAAAFLVNKSCDASREIALKQIEACKAAGGYVIGNSELASDRQCIVSGRQADIKQ